MAQIEDARCALTKGSSANRGGLDFNQGSDEENDALIKFKEHDRERAREKRVKGLELDRKVKYERKLDDFLRWEKNRQRDRERTEDRLKNLDAKKRQLIEDDLNYDSAEERRRAKRNPKEHKQLQDERKKLRQRERLEDEEDRKLEIQEGLEEHIQATGQPYTRQRFEFLADAGANYARVQKIGKYLK